MNDRNGDDEICYSQEIETERVKRSIMKRTRCEISESMALAMSAEELIGASPSA